MSRKYVCETECPLCGGMFVIATTDKRDSRELMFYHAVCPRYDCRLSIDKPAANIEEFKQVIEDFR